MREEDKKTIIELYVELEKQFGKDSLEMVDIHDCFKRFYPDIIYDSMRI